MASPKLAEAVLKATQLLDRLLSPAEAEPLHPEILKHCKALQFSFQSKTGLGLSWTSGFGFSIKKVGQADDGSPQWSAPAFSTFRAAGAGATVGQQTSQVLCALLSDKAINRIEAGGFDLQLGGDLNLTTVPLSGLPGGSLVSGQLDLLHLDSDVVSVGVADGVLLDASIAVGGLSEDKALHKELYGAAATPAEILNGAFAAPAEFVLLYARLNQEIKSAR